MMNSLRRQSRSDRALPGVKVSVHTSQKVTSLPNAPSTLKSHSCTHGMANIMQEGTPAVNVTTETRVCFNLVGNPSEFPGQNLAWNKRRLRSRRLVGHLARFVAILALGTSTPQPGMSRGPPVWPNTDIRAK